MKTKLLNTKGLAKAVLVAAVAVTTSSEALNIRHNRSTLVYENFGRFSRFDGSCVISRRNNANIGIAGATCFDNQFVILARHTLRNAENYMNNTGDLTQIRPRGAESALTQHQSNNRRVRIEQITYFDDDFSSFANAIDIAIAGSPFTIQPIRRAVLHNRSDELGRICSAASGANNRSDGDGNSRRNENENTSNSRDPRSVRWGGQNRVDEIIGNSRLIRTDFDSSRNSDPNTLGASSPHNREFGIAGGDSGSPIYIARGTVPNSISGILSGGLGGNRYGARTSYVRVSYYRFWAFDTLNSSPL